VDKESIRSGYWLVLMLYVSFSALSLLEGDRKGICNTQTQTHTQPFYGSLNFVQDYPSEP